MEGSLKDLSDYRLERAKEDLVRANLLKSSCKTWNISLI